MVATSIGSAPAGVSMADAPSTNRRPDRRTVLAGARAIVAGGSLLAACGGSDASGPAPSSGSSGGGTSTGAAGPLATVSSIPDGGTIAVQNPNGGTVLLTRNGTAVTGLNAKCTHQG